MGGLLGQQCKCIFFSVIFSAIPLCILVPQIRFGYCVIIAVFILDPHLSWFRSPSKYI
jgi:hypothetical protein